ncbi:MAG: N-acetylmuramoyl-L-alanine amidase family protein [Blautia sp.]|jgi:N-acetylmuramoyl-L-alanine amidase
MNEYKRQGSRKNAGRRRPAKKHPSNKRVKERNRNVMILLGSVLCVALVIFMGTRMYHAAKEKEAAKKASLETEDPLAGAPPLDVELLTVNEYSRPGIPLKQVKHVAIHYTANPGSTAMDNRNYFENLKDSHETKVSSHFIIGLEGEIIQCIPTAEISYATNERNVDTLSIECCHPDESGKFTDATYQSVVELTAWLCEKFGLSADDVIRHYDVTGKDCPRYYVQNPEAWEQMKADIGAKLKEDKS